MMKHKTVLFAIVAVMLLTVVTAPPVFAQHGRNWSGDPNSLLGGKITVYGQWTGGESYNINSFTDGNNVNVNQSSGFEVFGGYQVGKNVTLGLALQNAQNTNFNPQSEQDQAKMDETNVRVVGELNTRWFKIKDRSTPYPWWQASIGYAFDISGKNIDLHNGSMPRSGFNDVGVVHKDFFIVTIRCGFGSEKIGMGFLQIQLKRSITRISVHATDLGIKNNDVTSLNFGFGINI